MSIEDRRRARLLKRYVKLEKARKIRKVDCGVFSEIKDAISNRDLDGLSDIISKHSGYKVEKEDVLWFADEAIKVFPEDEILTSQLEAVVYAAEVAALSESSNLSEDGETLYTTIKIKRSHDSPAPPSLEEGELAYSYDSSSLFIGDADGSPRKIVDGSEELPDEVGAKSAPVDPQGSNK